MRSGRLHAAAIAVIEKDEVLDAIRQSRETISSSERNSSRLVSRSSTIASMMMGQEASASRESVMTRFASARATASRSSRPFSASLASCAETESFASRAASGRLSWSSTRMPACAAIWAMPRPMTPVPITARLRSGRETSRGMMQGGKGPILRVSIGSRRAALTFQCVLGKLARFGYWRRSRMPSLARIAVLGLFLALPAMAQEFPSRPITLICPWPAGGSTDTHLRRFAEVAAKYLGQPVLIENKPGGGGTIGPGHIAQTAKPDGYSLSQMHMGAFRIPHMQKLAWDPVRDFTYIIGLSGYTFGVVVKSDSPFKSFRDLLDYARANPGKMSYGSTGTGTSPHLLMEEVSMKTGVQFLHVPFKGNADSTQALLGDHIMAQSDSSGWGRFVDAGQFRLLVTFGRTRTKHWPTVPTANDLGLDMVYSSPYGIVGPRGTEPRVVKILHDGFKKALDDPENLKVLDQLDQELWYQSSEDYAKYARETLQRERALIERLGLLAK